jgi:hypothetical protein
MYFILIPILSISLTLSVRAFIVAPSSKITQAWPNMRRGLLSDEKMDIQVQEPRRISVKTYEELSANTGTMGLSGGIQIPVVTPKNATRPKSTFGIKSAEELLNSNTNVADNVLAAKRKPDLNGIKPWTPFVYAVAAALLSAGGWQVCSYLATHFATTFVDSPTYQIQRAAIIARNLVVGITALFTGFSGVIAVGLVLLGAAVTIGVLKGDLNPNDTNS